MISIFAFLIVLIFNNFTQAAELRIPKHPKSPPPVASHVTIGVTAMPKQIGACTKLLKEMKLCL